MQTLQCLIAAGISYEDCISVKYQIITSTQLSAVQLTPVHQDSFVDESTIRSVVNMFLMLLDDALGRSTGHVPNVAG